MEEEEEEDGRECRDSAAQTHVRTWACSETADTTYPRLLEGRCEVPSTAPGSMASPTFPVLPIQKFAGRNAPVRRPTVSTL